MKKYPEATKIYDKTKITLMTLPNTIFYTTLLFSLRQYWNENIPTANTNGKILNINPDWFLSLSPGARIGLLMHEMLHIALQHMLRLQDRDPNRYNQAADHVINLLLTNQNYILPDKALCDYRFIDMNTEQVYNIIVAEDPPPPEGEEGQDPPIPGCGNDLKPATDDNASAEIVNNILRATTAATLAGSDIGSLPGELLIQLDRKINPKLPWNVILANYMQSFNKDDYSWQRPNRRYMPDMYLPCLHGETIGNIGIAVDCSGSVTDHEFNFFIKEIATIQQYMNPEKITLLDFDTKIHHVHEITQSTDIYKDVSFSGRGGTDVTCVMEWAVKENPIVLLIFTDGDFYQPEVKPKCPVIWLIHSGGNFEPEFGKVITYNIED